VGTLKDLSLVLLIGIIIGTYSSIYTSSTLLVDLKLRRPEIQKHDTKVYDRRAEAAEKAAKSGASDDEIAIAAAGGPHHAAGAAGARLTRHVPAFPEPGVAFADLTPVFADGYALHMVVEAMSAPFVGVDLVAGIDARGFLLGSGIALTLGTGVLAVRKKGKLP